MESQDNDPDVVILESKKRKIMNNTNYQFHDIRNENDNDNDNDSKDGANLVGDDNESGMDDGMSQCDGERPMLLTGSKHRDNHRINDDDDDDIPFGVQQEDDQWMEKKRLFDVNYILFISRHTLRLYSIHLHIYVCLCYF